jgi:hypothetical protein
MKLKELKKLLEPFDDELEVFVPALELWDIEDYGWIEPTIGETDVKQYREQMEDEYAFEGMPDKFITITGDF